MISTNFTSFAFLTNNVEPQNNKRTTRSFAIMLIDSSGMWANSSRCIGSSRYKIDSHFSILPLLIPHKTLPLNPKVSGIGGKLLAVVAS